MPVCLSTPNLESLKKFRSFCDIKLQLFDFWRFVIILYETRNKFEHEMKCFRL
jgi:hypothetical protein